MELIALVAGGLGWWWVARLWKKRGNGPAVQHGAGLLTFVVLAGLVLAAPAEVDTANTTDDKLPTSSPAASSTDTSVNGPPERHSPSNNSPAGPVSTHSPKWQYIVNNALRTVDEHAMEREPRAAFVGPGVRTEFIKQLGGEHEGRYLLKVLNDQPGQVSLAMLLPLFDEYSPSDDLDDGAVLWRVVVAKFNGRDF